MLAITNAGRQYRLAIDEFSRALKRFSKFVSTGEVPDDLKK